MNELIQSFFTLTMKIAEVKIVQVQRPSNSDSSNNTSKSSEASRNESSNKYYQVCPCKNCNSPVQALSINAPSLGLVLHPPHQTQTFSLVPGIPAEPKLVDILRALT